MKFATSPLLIAALVFTVSGCHKSLSNETSLGSTSSLVPESMAQAIAESFNPKVFYNTSNPTNHDPIVNTLTGNNTITNIIAIKDQSNVPAIYVCNFADHQGFLFVSATYKVKPILGFVEDGEFNYNDFMARDKSIPPGFIKWMTMIVHNIQVVRQSPLDTAKYSQTFWKTYVSANTQKGASYTAKTLELSRKINEAVTETLADNPNTSPIGPTNPCTLDPGYTHDSSVGAGPLLAVAWGQEVTYNEDCLNLSCTEVSGPHVPTGCVATAGAMIIDYWKPTVPVAYNYAAMPATYGNSYLEQLMYDMGQYTGMSYSCSASSTSAGALQEAFDLTFNWPLPNLWTYTNTNNANLQRVITNLNEGYIVALSGNDSIGGHLWDCDGYSELWENYCYNDQLQTLYSVELHMNWGFHETFCNAPKNRPDYIGM